MKKQKHLPPIEGAPRDDGLWMFSGGKWHEIIWVEEDEEEEEPLYGEWDVVGEDVDFEGRPLEKNDDVDEDVVIEGSMRFFEDGDALR